MKNVVTKYIFFCLVELTNVENCEKLVKCIPNLDQPREICVVHSHIREGRPPFWEITNTILTLVWKSAVFILPIKELLTYGRFIIHFANLKHVQKVYMSFNVYRRHIKGLDPRKLSFIFRMPRIYLEGPESLLNIWKALRRSQKSLICL